MAARKRHLFLTIWLSLIIILNFCSVLFYLIKPHSFFEFYPTAPHWLPYVLALMGCINIICAIALFNWKKWGFWGICLVAIINIIIDISFRLSTVPVVIISAAIFLLILYLALQLGKENKAWNQLS